MTVVSIHTAYNRGAIVHHRACKNAGLEMRGEIAHADHDNDKYVVIWFDPDGCEYVAECSRDMFTLPWVDDNTTKTGESK